MAAVYGATAADVTARVPRMDISASSHPSTTDIAAWIVEAEAKLNNALKAGGITTPVTNAEGVVQLKGLTIDYAEGLLRRAAHFAGVGGEADGEDKLKAFTAVVLDIVDNPARWSAMLEGGTAEDETQRIRSHVASNDVADLAPVFTIADREGQF